MYVISGSPPIQGKFSSSWCPLYVGQTQNLRARFGDHLGNTTNVRRIRFFKNLKFHFFIMPDDTLKRRVVEQKLQDAFGPVASDRLALGVTAGYQIAAIIQEGVALTEDVIPQEKDTT